MNQRTTGLASSITKAGSKQTYYVIRFLVDRPRVDDAYRAYGYFRWLDDVLDSDSGSGSERRALLQRQKALLDSCYRNEPPRNANLYESMLVELVQRDRDRKSGLGAYLYNMMQVLDFDARRRGKLISQGELDAYTRWLAVAVTEAMHYFVGHGQSPPHDEARYQAVTGAHIAHLLRDTLEDVQAGYFNIPQEYLAANGIDPDDVESDAYRAWVQERAKLARACFKSGKAYLAGLTSIRCRIAGYAYVARFEMVLDVLKRREYRLAPGYPQAGGVGAAMRMGRSVLSHALFAALLR